MVFCVVKLFLGVGRVWGGLEVGYACFRLNVPMLVPDLHFTVHCFALIYVHSKADPTCPHTHTAANST